MRTHYCGLIDAAESGDAITLCGWVNKIRLQSHVAFIDVRDHTGLAQIVVERDNATAFAQAGELGYEYCIRVQGVLRERSSVNPKLKTGAVEVLVDTLEILNTARELPFALHENTNEDMRLRYRYLDLRRPAMQHKLRTRVKLVRAIRHYLDAADFQDIETPILTKATPEGARDYLVPSRLHPGASYALPQSPQLFKQLLMMAGFDRYYQIARCFRDEDLRADRQPEFTQLDMELAFVQEADIQQLAEDMLRTVFKDVIDVDLIEPFPRMTWHDAMRRFGSDKPDTRFGMELIDVADAVRHLDFKVFAGPANDPEGRVAALCVTGGSDLSRKNIDQLAAHAATYGAKGLAWLKLNDVDAGLDGVSSPIAKFLDAEALAAIVQATAAQSGDLLLFGAGPWQLVSEFMGAVRLKVGQDRGLVTDTFKPLWVTDFPMFEWDDDAARYVALHHPFTAPKTDSLDTLDSDPAAVLSRSYDMVLNGAEIGGGSIRIHRPDMQRKVLELLGIGGAEADAKFGFLLKALQFGAPPHGGIAFGIDRIAAIMAGTDSIRDVIAFPKTTSAQDLMTEAPSPVAEAQMQELHLQVLNPD